MVLFFVLLLASAMASFLRRVAVDAGDRRRTATARSRPRRWRAAGCDSPRRSCSKTSARKRASGRTRQPPRPVGARRRLDLVDDPDVDLQRAHRRRRGAHQPERIPRQRASSTREDALFLQQLLAGVIAIMPGRPEELHYDPAELAANLADWIDERRRERERRIRRRALRAPRSPLHRTPNRPLLSVDELRLVDGLRRPARRRVAPLRRRLPAGGRRRRQSQHRSAVGADPAPARLRGERPAAARGRGRAPHRRRPRGRPDLRRRRSGRRTARPSPSCSKATRSSRRRPNARTCSW